MKLPRRQFMRLTAGAAMLRPLPRVAMAADAYPSRAIHLIVGSAPGATSDITGRVFARGATPIVGQQIVVENKPGSAGNVATQYVARATNDGYTLVMLTVGALTNSITNPASSVDYSKDFAPIALLANGFFVLVVSPGTNVHSVAELVSLAKSKPGELLFGSVGPGSVPHLIAELFAQRAGVKLMHVPYPSGPPIASDLVAGRITMSFISVSEVMGQIAAGELTALATTADKRSSALPNVPTMAEVGMPDLVSGLWLGLLAPAGTPPLVIQKLADAAHKAMHTPEAVEMLGRQGYEPLAAGPDEFGAFIRSQIALWSQVARTAGLKG
jgi:tripartite-type tricarboxylate transporter receptor subunit TctC